MAAGGAIGGAVARAFAREGARLHLAGRSLARLDAVVQGHQGGRRQCRNAQSVDAVGRDCRREAMSPRWRRAPAHIDILFNAIGMEDIQGSELVDMPFDDFFKPIRKAAATQYTTSRAVAPPHGQRQGSGVIMTVTAGPPEAMPQDRRLRTRLPDDRRAVARACCRIVAARRARRLPAFGRRRSTRRISRRWCDSTPKPPACPARRSSPSLAAVSCCDDCRRSPRSPRWPR